LAQFGTLCITITIHFCSRHPYKRNHIEEGTTKKPTWESRLVQQSESPETVDLSRRERLALVGPASKRYQDFHSVPLGFPARGSAFRPRDTRAVPALRKFRLRGSRRLVLECESLRRARSSSVRKMYCNGSKSTTMAPCSKPTAVHQDVMKRLTNTTLLD
jgi:hypothetical protein